MENKNGFFVAHMDSYSSLFFVGKNDSWETWTPSIEKNKKTEVCIHPWKLKWNLNMTQLTRKVTDDARWFSRFKSHEKGKQIHWYIRLMHILLLISIAFIYIYTHGRLFYPFWGLWNCLLSEFFFHQAVELDGIEVQPMENGWFWSGLPSLKLT